MQLGETTESTDLTHLDSFVGPPGTGAPMAQVGCCRHPCRTHCFAAGWLAAMPGTPPRRPLTVPFPAVLCPPVLPGPPALLQPFQVTIDRQAVLVMDFHAHLRWQQGSPGSGARVLLLLGVVWLLGCTCWRLPAPLFHPNSPHVVQPV